MTISLIQKDIKSIKTQLIRIIVVGTAHYSYRFDTLLYI